MELSFAPVMVKTNCLQLVNALAVGEGEDSSEIGRLVVGIFFAQLHFFHVCCESNVEAHKLAKELEFTDVVAYHLNIVLASSTVVK